MNINNKKMTATLVGATGLIGSSLLEELLTDSYFDTVRILIRRPIDITHTKLEKKIVDFNDSDSVLVALSNSEVVFCAIGVNNEKSKR
jgi:aspartate-semialdehyde dehydrogenase